MSTSDTAASLQETYDLAVYLYGARSPQALAAEREACFFFQRYAATDDSGILSNGAFSMILSDSGSTSFEQPPTGSHAGRCISIIDLGTQRSTYEGETQIKRQVVVRWELSNELMTTGDFAGKPFTVSKFYTASLHEKAGLRKDLASWRGRDFTPEELKHFDLASVLGKPCMLSVGLSEKGKAKVTSVMGLPKGMVVPGQVNPSLHFSLSADEFDNQIFESLSKGFKDMVASSPEYAQLMKRRANHHEAPAPHDEAEMAGGDIGMDEIPFISASAWFDMMPRKARRMLRHG